MASAKRYVLIRSVQPFRVFWNMTLFSLRVFRSTIKFLHVLQCILLKHPLWGLSSYAFSVSYHGFLPVNHQTICLLTSSYAFWTNLPKFPANILYFHVFHTFLSVLNKPVHKIQNHTSRFHTFLYIPCDPSAHMSKCHTFLHVPSTFLYVPAGEIQMSIFIRSYTFRLRSCTSRANPPTKQ